jgi:hypothetical protein
VANSEELGLGKCFCGKWAMVGINGKSVCEQHMNEMFAEIRKAVGY